MFKKKKKTLKMNDTSRMDVIKKMTDSLASGNNNLNTSTSNGSNSVIVNQGTSLLYKFGHEVGTVGLTSTAIKNHLPNSIPSLGRNKASRGSFTDSRDPTELAESSFYGDEALINNNNNNSHTQFIVNMDKARASKSVKLVSGSQFRLTTKDNIKCEHCDLLEKVNKKTKETVRSLKLQLTRLEEKFHELKLSKSASDSLSLIQKTMENKDNNNNNNNNTNIDDNIDKLIKKCEIYEDEINKLKKIISIEKISHDNYRKNFDEIKNILKTEILDTKNINKELEKELNMLKTEISEKDLNILHLHEIINSYKLQLESKNKEKFLNF
jgi:hypothetical protein